MSPHSETLVHVASMPDLHDRRISIADLGSLAGALVYYDRVYFNVDGAAGLGDLVRWFLRSNQLEELCRLLRERILVPFQYGFVVASLRKGALEQGLGFITPTDSTSTGHPKPRTFDFAGVVNSRDVRRVLGMGRRFKDFRHAALTSPVEEASDGFEPSIRNAEADYFDPHRCQRYLHAWIDREYSRRGVRYPPAVGVHVARETATDGSSGHRVEWDASTVAVSELAKRGIELPTAGLVLSQVGHTTRLVWSAGKRGLDIWPGEALSPVCCDKIAESLDKCANGRSTIGQLEARVEFPDLVRLVNEGTLGAWDILEIRAKAIRFREWLQSEKDHDRDAVLSYLGQLAETTGLQRLGTHVLRIAIVAGSSGAGAIGGPTVAAAAGALAYLADVGAKLVGGWQPFIFGRWLAGRVSHPADGGEEQPLPLLAPATPEE